MAVTVPRSLFLDSVSSGSRCFRFKAPLEVEVTCSDGIWTLVHAASGLNRYGETLDEALDRFAQDVAYAWDEYASRSEDGLGKLARNTKAALLHLVALQLTCYGTE